jgi:hypothetical protein
MDKNITIDSVATLNIVVVENLATVISLIANSIVVVTVSLAKSFPDISKIEVFAGENYICLTTVFNLI